MIEFASSSSLYGTDNVDDIARGTIAGLKPLGYEVINLGGDRPVPLHEIISQIGRLTGREPIIEYRDIHPADVPATWANVGEREIDWAGNRGSA